MRIYNVSSYKRKENLLKTIESIYKQADKINVALNCYEQVPEKLKDTKIHVFRTDNLLGDAYKFLNLEYEDGYYFTIDDDLLYPNNYSEFMIEQVEAYKRKSIITLHGRSFDKFPIVSYYKSKTLQLRCTDDVKETRNVQFGGTGVMCFHTDLCRIPLDYFKIANMADIWVGCYAMENNIDIICIKHKRGFIKQQLVSKSIYGELHNNCKSQTETVNMYFGDYVPRNKTLPIQTQARKSIIHAEPQPKKLPQFYVIRANDNTLIRQKQANISIAIQNYPKGALILGNGNSIKSIDDKFINGYYTIGVNMIGRKFNPNILLLVDNPNSFSTENRGIVCNSQPDLFFVRSGLRWILPQEKVYSYDLGELGKLKNLDKDYNILDYGFDSPYIAIQLAYKLGFKKIDVIGIDYTKNHFYSDTGDHQNNERFSQVDKLYENLYRELTKRGCEIQNLSMDSRLTGIPKYKI